MERMKSVKAEVPILEKKHIGDVGNEETLHHPAGLGRA